jgi:CubicO group peptidase (beta-lactamase class C family)
VLAPIANANPVDLDRALRNEPGVVSAVVERNGRVTFEHYYRGATRTTRLDVFSVTKSVMSTLIGIAVRRGALRLDQPLADFFPREARSARDKRVRTITVRHLLTMTSGYRDSRVIASDDWVDVLIHRPLAAPPGRTFSYDNGSYHLLSAVLTKAVGMTAQEYAQRVLFGPLGIAPPRWSSDGQGHSLGNTGLRLAPRELLRLGELYLHGGRWRGRQVVPAAYVRAATVEHSAQGYGYGWWAFRYRGADGFAALGANGQIIGVFPSRHVVAVLTGTGSDAGRLLFRVVLPALNLR